MVQPRFVGAEKQSARAQQAVSAYNARVVARRPSRRRRLDFRDFKSRSRADSGKVHLGPNRWVALGVGFAATRVGAKRHS